MFLSVAIKHVGAFFVAQQEVTLGPCIIPDEDVGVKVVEKTLCVKDPDGYSFEISEAAYRRDPVSKVSVLVLDMEKSINFYQDVSKYSSRCVATLVH